MTNVRGIGLQHLGRDESSSDGRGRMPSVASLVSRVRKRWCTPTAPQPASDRPVFETSGALPVVFNVQPRRVPTMTPDLDKPLPPTPAASTHTRKSVGKQWSQLSISWPDQDLVVKYPKVTTHVIHEAESPPKHGDLLKLVYFPKPWYHSFENNRFVAGAGHADDASLWVITTAKYDIGDVVIKHRYAPTATIITSCDPLADGKPMAEIRPNPMTIPGPVTSATVSCEPASQKVTDNSPVAGIPEVVRGPRRSSLLSCSSEEDLDNADDEDEAQNANIPSVYPVSRRASLFSISSEEDEAQDADIPKVRPVSRRSSLFSIASGESDAPQVHQAAHRSPLFSDFSDEEQQSPLDSSSSFE